MNDAPTLTREQRRQRRLNAVAAVASGRSVPDVAKEFGLCESTLLNYCHNWDQWKHHGERQGLSALTR